jgi:hypothetical protein
MPRIDREKVRRLIRLARKVHERERTEEPAGRVRQDDSGRKQFRAAVDDLGSRNQQELLGLMALGRGDYGVEEWAAAMDYASDAWSEAIGHYLMSHPDFAEYLSAGLEILDDHDR